MESPINPAPFTLAGVIGTIAIALAMTACSGPSDAPNPTPPPSSPSAGEIPPAPQLDSAPVTTDPSLPAVPDAASAAQPAAGAQASDPPMKPMSKGEEATAMPMPGQANDHSTVAKDGKK